MAPRKYTQRGRAAGSERTRSRIIEAAVIEYRERGVANASIKAIASRADVSRGTVLNHFGDVDGVLAAVLETATSSLQFPTQESLEGAKGLAERARRFAEEMLRFYERTADWWHVFAGEHGELPTSAAFEEREKQFWATIGEFQNAALGELASHPTVLGAMSVLITWNTVGQMKAVGLDADSAVALAADLFTDAVRHAARSSSAGG